MKVDIEINTPAEVEDEWKTLTEEERTAYRRAYFTALGTLTALSDKADKWKEGLETIFAPSHKVCNTVSLGAMRDFLSATLTKLQRRTADLEWALNLLPQEEQPKPGTGEDAVESEDDSDQ